ncbi:hypothetical protein IG193_08475 [Infirmifilum lucidum]|uniref:Dolichol kinase n=1 Tax=Infirmifilum lucidum TaxID=2776706 RepID=A0A7L9FG90_9CREN|nr:hypothetical protein [Infirmifilum lucidum]QOJ78769.1 hypothetical protein IG193_08475 [Infirmifilum lucidum]
MREEVVAEIRRKSIHAIPGFMAIPVVVWLGNPYATAIACFFLVLYALNEASLRLKLNWRIPIAWHTYRLMARRDELERGYFTGTVYFWAVTTAVVWLMEPHLAAATVMVSSFGDAAAAIFGKALGGPRVPLSNKTLTGFAGMFLASMASTLICGVRVEAALLASLLSAAVELATPLSTLDELTVPVTAALSLQLLAGAR